MSGWLHLLQREEPEQGGLNNQRNTWTLDRAVWHCSSASLRLLHVPIISLSGCSAPVRPAGLLELKIFYEKQQNKRMRKV